jgi:hypothetical protein
MIEPSQRMLRIKSKEKNWEEAMHIVDTQRLDIEIEMLQKLYCIW